MIVALLVVHTVVVLVCMVLVFIATGHRVTGCGGCSAAVCSSASW